MVKKKKEDKTRIFPLINKINENDNNHDFIEGHNFFELPLYISQNLKHQLRPYQKNAISNLDWTQHNKDVDEKFKELLFNMATGSGKTDIMAAMILYMYSEFDYHNFMFVVNTNSVLTKTIDNLLNSDSTKYLFKDPININNEDIIINRVHNFPQNTENGVINLKLTTIQSLSSEINNPRENGLTKESLKDINLVTLADEAHHLNTLTSKKNKLTKTDEEHISWEKVLSDILALNPKNRQLDFTATLDFQDDSIYDKYKDITVYRYVLGDFINDKYAKKVMRIQASSDDQSRMLNAVLLSQYRKKVAESLGIQNFKPVVMFKSTMVKTSISANESFIQMIDKLTVDKLLDFIHKQYSISNSEALKLCYQYFLDQDKNGNFFSILTELKKDFKPLNIINANSSSNDGILGDNNYHNLNTLDDINNPFRVIFAVAKLTEGWDVLNLYDIVRIGNDKTSTKNIKEEAQLVGRGARYYPFIYDDNKKYTRRFDNADFEYSFLETIHYHTLSESKYIEKLNDAFDRIDLPAGDDSSYRIYHANIKKGFKKSSIYKNGNFYYNKTIKNTDDNYDSLSKYNVPKYYEAIMIEGSFESDYNAKIDITSNADLIFVFKLTSAKRILQKAMGKNKFYRFNTLKRYIPVLKTMDEFINDDDWLGDVTINAYVDHGVKELSVDEQLKAVSEYLNLVQERITKNFHKYRGTNKFVSKPIKDVVANYSKRVPTITDKSYREHIQEFSMIDNKWFVYDNAIVDGLEKDLIDLIGTYVDRLLKKYNDVYLFRNEETQNGINLHQFDENDYNYSGYMPDFILYLDDGNICYQIYVEAKGKQLLAQDNWKEILLQDIYPDNIDVIGENDKVKLYGARFYKSQDFGKDNANIRKDIEKFL